jgi:hypothetical protein
MSCTTIPDTSFGSAVEARAYQGPGRQNVSVSILINRSAVRGCGTCLVYHIDKRLRVVPNEGTDSITRIVTRENGLDEGGEFVWSKRASYQTFTGWESKLRKEKNQEAISVQRKTMKAGQNAYRSRIQRSWGCQRVPSCCSPPNYPVVLAVSPTPAWAARTMTRPSPRVGRCPAKRHSHCPEVSSISLFPCPMSDFYPFVAAVAMVDWGHP